MAIEFTPKPKVIIPLWASLLLVLAIILLIALGTVYYLIWSSSQKMSQRIEEIDMALIPTIQEKELEREVTAWEKKINDFSNLISRHSNTMNILSFLERISHPRTWFSNVLLTPDKKTVSLAGKIDGAESLGQQLTFLKEDPSVKNINLTKISVSERGEIDFIINLIFNPEIFKF